MAGSNRSKNAWTAADYTASKGGSRFVERILTVIATACQQHIDLMGYLYDAMSVRREGRTAPVLL